MKLIERIHAVQKEIGVLKKDAKNPFYKSEYLTLTAINAALHPLLEKHKLTIIQPIIDNNVTTIIMNDEGEKFESALKLPDLSDPQKIGSCITYYRRYTLVSLLNIDQVDDDGNAASGVQEEKSDDNLDPEGNEKKWLNDKDPKFAQIKAKYKSGTTIQELRKWYKISKATLAALEA